MIIPGFVITWLTFPGVIVHEAAHLLFCKLFRIPVWEVCFFQFGNPAGYVIHKQPRKFTATFFVSLGPFILNSVLCVFFCSAAFAPIWVLKVEDPVGYFFAWLGLSMGMNAFPSRQDLSHIWRMAPGLARHGNVLAILSMPLVAVLFVLNLARVVWADLLYGIAIGFLGPLAVLKILA